MTKTSIEWTEETWNPIRARNKATGGIGHFCVHMSEGCRNCFSERLQPRFRNAVRFAAQDLDKVEIYPDEKVLMQPLHWRRGRKIFPCDMTDLFGEWVPDAWLDRIFAVMALTPQHTYQVLTKRTARMQAWFAKYDSAHDHNTADRVADQVALILGRPGAKGSARTEGSGWSEWPLPNVWLGTSVEDQTAADQRIPDLLSTPAALRFLSVEPMIGPVDLSEWLFPFKPCEGCPCPNPEINRSRLEDCCRDPELLSSPIHWVIVGGESGAKARPMRPDWARSIRDQCVAAGVPFFFKQWGEWHPCELDPDSLDGGCPVCRPMEGHAPFNSWKAPIYDTESTDKWNWRRLGKKAAGRTLDGRTWDEFPPPAP